MLYGELRGSPIIAPYNFFCPSFSEVENRMQTGHFSTNRHPAGLILVRTTHSMFLSPGVSHRIALKINLYQFTVAFNDTYEHENIGKHTKQYKA